MDQDPILFQILYVILSLAIIVTLAFLTRKKANPPPDSKNQESENPEPQPQAE